MNLKLEKKVKNRLVEKICLKNQKIIPINLKYFSKIQTN